MSNMSDLESINSVCTTAEELIRSEDFIRWITIILEKVKTFDKNYILSLFTKLKNGEILDDEEKEGLNTFVYSDNVARLGQSLLSKLRNTWVNVKTNNIAELTSFTELLNSIFAEDWFKKVQLCIWKVANISELTLNGYEWMRKIMIKVNWVEKEVYMDEENLKVDSSKWKEIQIDWVKVRINPEWDIIEYFEWELAWEQLFTWDAAMRESEKLWKRLPFADDDDKEFQAIIDEVWVEEFSKLCPGYLNPDRDKIFDSGMLLRLWSASSFIYRGYDEEAYNIDFDKRYPPFHRFWNGRFNLFSVRLIKDWNANDIQKN